jgi:arylsulfatase A-like enzyme/Tfp pilus assembly protein PilF
VSGRGERPRGAACLAWLLALAGCGPAPAPGPPAAERFVLITIDTLRADHVGCYGAVDATTPTLDALAARGVRFESAISPAPLTLPAHATLLTALDPPGHGVRSNGLFRLRDELPTLAERMRGAGFATAAFVSAFVLDRRFGLARGFDIYDDALGVQDPDNPGVAARPADQSVDAALAWLADAPPRFLLWLHLYDPHAPYEPPVPHASRHLGAPYAGEIAFADAELGRLLAALDARFPASGTLVVATADHGESLGEHGEPTHAFTLYDATQRVPLLMAGPGLPADRVVASQVRLADVPATLLDAAGLEPLPDADGASLLPLVRGEPEPAARVAWLETLATRLELGWSALLGVRTPEHKYIRAPRRELYDLRADPRELKNLAGERPALVAELDALVEARAASQSASPNLRAEAETVERLRALGYLAEAPDAQAGLALGVVGGPDPKDEIGKLETIREAITLLVAERGAEAFERLATLGQLGFELELLRGTAALRARRYSEARASAARARALAPGRAGAHLLLGKVAEAEGRGTQAEAAFAAALGADPEAGEAAVGLGRLAEARGQLDEARRHFEAALRLRQLPPECLWRLAALEIEAGRPSAARELLTRLPQLAARRPEAAARLARAYRAAGRRDLARLRIEGALRDRPEHVELLLAQAELMEDDARLEDALRTRERALAAEPDEPGPALAVARHLALAGRDLDRALALAEDARAPEGLATLALVRLARGEAEAALPLADEGLAAGSHRPELLLRRAEALAALGRLSEARNALDQARQQAPRGTLPTLELARVERLLARP